MAVYRRGYERYRGPLRGRWARFAVLPRYTWSRLLGNRPVVLLAALSMVWPLVSAAGLYVGNHIELLEASVSVRNPRTSSGATAGSFWCS